MRVNWTKVLLAAVIVLHFYVVFVNIAAMFILPFTYSYFSSHIPFWLFAMYVTPIESAIVYLAFNRSPCPLTRYENHLRKQLGMREIGGFIGYYLIKQKWRKKVEHVEEGISIRSIA